MTNRRSLMLPASAASVVLTMVSLGQVFQRQRWLMPSLLAVLVAFGVGWAGRRLDVPGILSPALSMLAMLTLLGIVFHADTTAIGVPTAATMQAIGDSLGSAVSDIKTLAPPADPTDALTLLATAGVFVVAALVDLLVFRLRRPVAAGMPLLALFLVPTSMSNSGNVFAFVLAAVGYLGILVAEGRDRARAWGRRLSGVERADEFADVSHVARVGRRIGSAAVGIALCVPLALPSVGDGILDGSGGDGIIGRGRGDRTAFVLNPIVEIRTRIQTSERRALFTVDTPSRQYLRLTTLDIFDGEEWTIDKRKTGSDHRVSGDDDDQIPLPDEYEGQTQTSIQYTVTIGSDLAVNWLPLAYAPRRVEVSKNEDWRYEDLNYAVFTTERTSQNITYRAESVIAEPSEEQLRAGGELPKEIREKYLQLPDKQPPASALEVLRTQLAGKDNAYDKALALNDYFYASGLFTYSLEVPTGNDTDVLDAFLKRRTGYCEQFAAAMAYLARLAGLPSRVVVGFTPGGQQPDGTYVVTNKDAHAWPELYFPQAGWVRFEPTPRPGTELPGFYPPPADPRGGDVDPTPSDGPTAPPTEDQAEKDKRLAEAQEQEQVDPPGAVDDPAVAGGGGDGGVPVAPLAGLAFAGLVATPSAVGWATRRRRRSRAADAVGRIHAAWETLADAAEDAGHRLRAADSPRGAGRRLVAAAGLSGAPAEEVLRLAAAEERARYARSADPVDGLDASARLVRRTLLGSLPKVARVRALVFPASALRRIGEVWRSGAAAFDRRRDAARAKAAGLVPRRRRPKAA